MRFQTLAEWLRWQETLHPKAIDLGLERPGEVLRRMGLSSRPAHFVFTVAGTNGKGSTVAMLEAILRAAGYRVGSYTSPHLLRYNERIRIDGAEVTDVALCAAFDRVDQARGEISLSYFEFGTLAALDLFARAGLDAAVLEVGMGGRLDAVNLMDADVAVITPIDVDHAEWLGADRESIAREKAGIFRAGRPAVCSDPSPPAMLAAEAARLGTRLYSLGHEFECATGDAQWWWQGPRGRLELPWPRLRGRSQPQNAAGVLMALELAAARLPVMPGHLAEGLLTAELPGRFQVESGPVTRIFDVGHNPHAARELARNLGMLPAAGRTLAVWAMLGDKDATGVIEVLRGSFDHWHVAGLAGARGREAGNLRQLLAGQGIAGCTAHATVAAAWRAALDEARPGDRVVVFGSFHTVAEALGAPV